MADPPVSPERWAAVKALFGEAIARPSAERRAWLEEACAGDPSLFDEVASLLAAHDTADALVDHPAALVHAEPAAPLEGRVIGPYRLERELGRGGMGAVFLAVRADDAYRKRVALKVIKRGMDTDEIVARFRRERQTLANLEHPHIARLLDGGTTDDGLPYFVLEYIEGEPIDRYCAGRQLPIPARIDLFRQVCGAVDFAHRNLVVHRDLKPDNILVTADGVPKLLDFGIAKVLGPEGSGGTVVETRPADRLLTLEYASPEQILGEPVSTASDVFSLGILLYELLTGVHPFREMGHSPRGIEQAICVADPARPSAAAPARARQLAGDLDTIVLAAIRKEPARRYGSARELDEDLRRHLEGQPVAAEGDRFAYVAGKFLRRHAGAASATALVLLALVGGIIGTAWQARIAQAERDRARLEADKASQVSGVLQQMLRAPDPSVAGRHVTVAEVLDEASRRIGVELREQPDVRGAVRSAIGMTYHSLGLLDEAAASLDEALVIARELHGDHHPATARARLDRAFVTLAQGDVPDARAAFQEAADALETARPGDEDARADAYKGLGLAAAREGRGDEATQHYEQALAILRETTDGPDARVAELLNNLAVQAQARGHLAEAERLYREALRIGADVHGTAFPGYAAGLSNLAGVLQSQGRLDDAAAHYEQALALRRDMLGPDHPDVAFTEFNYADLRLEQGAHAEALALAERILARRGRTLPDRHPIVPAALVASGRARLGLGDHAAAERDIREGLALRREILPPDHWLLATTESILGECLMARGRTVEAERLLAASFEALLASRGPDHERTRDARRRLVRLYEATGRPQLAAGLPGR